MGVEPTRSNEPRILSPLCLPVPSLRHKNGFCKSRTCLVRLTVLSTNRCTKNPQYMYLIVPNLLYTNTSIPIKSLLIQFY